MAILSDRERTTLTAISQIAWCNPFLGERTALEKTALGSRFVEDRPVWSASVTNPEARSQNVLRTHDVLETLVPQIQARMASAEPTTSERALYVDCVQYLIYQRCHREFDHPDPQPAKRWRFYRK